MRTGEQRRETGLAGDHYSWLVSDAWGLSPGPLLKGPPVSEGGRRENGERGEEEREMMGRGRGRGRGGG